MKNRAFSLLASIALLWFASCTDGMQELAGEQSPALKQIVMTTQDFQSEAGSRTVYHIADGAVNCTWAANDTVGVFPDKGAQAYFPMASGAGTKNATFDGEGWALKDGRTYGAYYPFVGAMYLDRNAVPVSYIGQTQTGNASMEHLGAYDYMVATPTAPEFGSAQFMFKHISALVQLKLTIPQPATLTSVKLAADTKAFTVEGKVDIMADTPSITAVTSAKEIKLDLQNVATTEVNQVVTLYLMLPPADLSAQTLKAVVVSDKGKLEFALESKNFQAGKAYALSGSVESGDIVGDGSYKNGVVSLAEAGTMKKLLGSDYLNITSLKVVGPINGDDVYYLRKMLGGNNFSQADWGKLETLDLSDASIVEGGGWYYEYSYYTAHDVIGERMFYDCANLKEIVLPDNVTWIGSSAFSGCSSLTSIDIPDHVTSIGESAFRGCDDLTSIDIPDNVTSIPYSAFSGCSSLTSIDIPDHVTSIPDFAFYGCSALTSIDIPDNVTSIGDNAFSYCDALTFIDIPDHVTSIPYRAFYECDALTSIDIPDNVTSIGEGAFEDCDALTSIDIPDNVTLIGERAFLYCSALTTVTIGDGVTSIGKYAFYDCYALTDFYCHATTPPSINTSKSYYSFPTYGDKTTLHVPERCGSTYKSSDWGKYFKSIVEMD